MMIGYPRDFELFNDVIDKKIEKGGLKHLGSGGFGDVLLYSSKNSDVVIKRVKSGQGCKNLKEFKIHELLSKDGNKHIIQLFDVLKTQKFLFFYLEFAAAGDLEQMIKAKGNAVIYYCQGVLHPDDRWNSIHAQPRNSTSRSEASEFIFDI
ncbi:hypothetical protein GCK72_026114 [Caenorhabditis remanei]|uniref:Protein kinase domain-containing protein n=1 Tax=Caenorhabditis remanei TaxID=31234 RepID=A0A6A5G3Y9_CAERE|nr:hypothetical protein GCK72_026114 [Caenorhabditis remanei]KAF1749646.1 hypothetical protein GCK72_026114 [Caenorhabditis remanei]